MKRSLTPEAVKNYSDAPVEVQKAFDKQAKLLVKNLRYPSLHAKKYLKNADVWQARVTGSWRFYFVINNDTYVILSIKQHPK
jgi:mRNA-degrading endonuclease RelE of RelBE toxin-antitoxin system